MTVEQSRAHYVEPLRVSVTVGASNTEFVQSDRLTARIGKFGTVQMPPSWADVDPAIVLGAAEELLLEGIVYKQLDSALGKDAAAEAPPIRGSSARNFPTGPLAC
jgi:hypothetical protein